MLNKIPLKGNIRIKKEDRGYVVFNLDTSGFHLLTEDGVNILNNCDGKKNNRDILSIVYKDFQLGDKLIEKEFNKFLKDLISRKIIQWK